MKCKVGILSFAVTLTALAERPNVLLIITDDQNTDTVGCYGGAVQTPHIDSLAENGIRFTNGNVVHSVCSPSRYAMLTGRYYDNCTGSSYLEMYPRGTHSCVNNFMELERDGMNLPAVMKANGYTTGYIGKFHLTDHHLLYNNKEWEASGLQTYPSDADPRTDAAVNAKMKANHAWWCNRMKSLGFDWVDGFYPANLREGFNEYLDVHNVEWTADAAIRFIKEQKGKEKPFFVTMATTYPHGPGPHAKPGGIYKYSLDADVQLTGEGVVTDRDLSGVLAGETRESCKRLDAVAGMDVRASTALWWDAAVGAALKALKETGQLENTLVIYISDHGQKNAGKTTLYETGIHVPLLMQWPARFGGGQTYDHVVGSIDLAPTIMEACGIKKPTEYTMDGISLLPVLNGSSAPVRDALFMQMGYAHGVKTDNWKYIAVRYPPQEEQMLLDGKQDPQWKSWKEDTVPDRPNLMLHSELSRKARTANPHYYERNQLYNLKADPNEANNLFAEMPEKGAQMKVTLNNAIAEHIPHRPFGEFGPLGDPEEYSHVSNVVLDELPGKAEARAVSVVASDVMTHREPWCEIQCPAVLQVGKPFELRFTADGLDDGLYVGTVIKALSKKGAPMGVVGRFKRISNLENGKVYTLSTVVDAVPDGVDALSCNFVVSPTGRYEDRTYNTIIKNIRIKR